MGAAIHTKFQRNVWGTTNALREPQRTDLWYVDLTNAISQINSALRYHGVEGGIDIGSWWPQYARSITLPAAMIKAETYLQDNIPIQQPAEDEALGEIKISFVWDTTTQVNNSYITQLLQIWHDLVRAGRGSRYQGYQGSEGVYGDRSSWLALDDNYQINCNFDVAIVLLRGGQQPANSASASQTASASAQLRALEANAVAKARIGKQLSDGAKTGAALSINAKDAFGATTSSTVSPIFQTPNLEIAAAYRICRMWLAGYKLPDLDYEAAKIGTIDATFYASAILPLESATIARV